jgi:hypothetical protein
MKIFIKFVAGKSLLNLARIIKSKRSVIKSAKVGLYYKGGFDSKMTKREAYLILGVRTTASASEIKDRHKRLMILNHPDSGNTNIP